MLHIVASKNLADKPRIKMWMVHSPSLSLRSRESVTSREMRRLLSRVAHESAASRNVSVKTIESDSGQKV